MNIPALPGTPPEPAKLPPAPMIETESDALLLFDANHRLCWCNAGAEAVLPGLSAVAGLVVDDVLARLAAALGLAKPRQWPAAEGRTVCTTGDGRRYLLSWSRAGDGRMLLAAELPEADSAAETETADFFWETDRHMRVTHVSAGLARISGLPASAWLRKGPNGVGRQIVADEAERSRLIEALRNHAPFRDVRVRLRGPRRCHVSLSGRPVRDAAGAMVGFRGFGRDITREVEDQMERRRFQDRLVAALQNLTDDFLLFDEDERLVMCNTRFRASLQEIAESMLPGMTIEQVLAVLAAESVDAAERDAWLARRIEAHRLGESYEERLRDGRWMLVKTARIGHGLVVTRTDITALREREQAMRSSEAFFRAIFENTVVGIAVIDPGGRIRRANQAFEEMFGYGGEELRHIKYTELIHPEDLAEDERLTRLLASGEAGHYHLEERYLRKDRTFFWGKLAVSMVAGEGRRPFAVAMIEDVDAAKRAQRELAMFRAVVEAAHEAVAIIAPDGRLIYTNPAHERLFGRRMPATASQGYRDYFTAISRVLIERELIPALLRGESWEGVLEAENTDGRSFPLWQRAGVVRDGAGRARFYFAFMHDHTPQKQVEDEMFKAKEAAEQANLAKTRFLAAASHDLRQPMQALAMFVAVLSNRNHSPENSALIARIQDSVSAVEGLLNGLLDVSKLEAGLVVPEETTFAVGAMLERLGAEFEPLAGAAGLSLRWVGSRATVRSDPALLERILRNLLNNALRYTNTGRILFGCRRRGDKLRIEVWDTGIGIPRSQIKLIFREFHQLGNPARDRRQGLGLGLAIVERLAALLGHPIDVISVPNKGSMFAVEVPLAETPRLRAKPRQLNLDIRSSGALVVIIDDEPNVLESIRLLLECWGHRTITAYDCDDALWQLSEAKQVPDLIIADYRLQHGNTGGQAIARIRVRLRAPVPAIILTGDTAPERLRQAQASGHGLLHKPVQADALRNAIDEALSTTPPRPQARAGG